MVTKKELEEKEERKQRLIDRVTKEIKEWEAINGKVKYCPEWLKEHYPSYLKHNNLEE
jgi:hypothetical protein